MWREKEMNGWREDHLLYIGERKERRHCMCVSPERSCRTKTRTSLRGVWKVNEFKNKKVVSPNVKRGRKSAFSMQWKVQKRSWRKRENNETLKKWRKRRKIYREKIWQWKKWKKITNLNFEEGKKSAYLSLKITTKINNNTKLQLS